MEDRHYLVGTAGHVDHGKTELIRALTGIETDRLKEEKLRGISIELGFAHLELPNGHKVGIVDVPGHERFVRQMLAGASGMDAVLFVVAADEGIMPQSREHLDILTLLGVSTGIIVITKIDLVDQEWLELIAEEIKEELKNSTLANAPVCYVSSKTGKGVRELKDKLEIVLEEAHTKKSTGPVHMPIDRVFSVQGFGTVVTGTLHSGTISLGMDIEVAPLGTFAKVRSLQVHGKKVELAVAGQRTAVNLSGIEVQDVERGAVLVTPGAFNNGQIIDVKLRNLTSVAKPITHRQRIRFHIGTTEVLGRTHLLEGDELAPGAEMFAQILLEAPVVAEPGDKFILRFYSPTFTIGGGKVLGLAAKKRRRFKREVLQELERKEKGDLSELVLDNLKNPMSLKELIQSLNRPEEEIKHSLIKLIDKTEVQEWAKTGDSVFWTSNSSEEWFNALTRVVKEYEIKHPLRLGIGREELKGILNVKWPPRRWQLILEEGTALNLYRIEGNKVKSIQPHPLPQKMEQQINCLDQKFREAGLTPPDPNDAAHSCGIDTDLPEILGYLSETGKVEAIKGIYFSTQALEQGKNKLIELLKQVDGVSIAEIRELWNTSRKFAVPLLEYLDEKKITRREGDKRVLNRQ